MIKSDLYIYGFKPEEPMTRIYLEDILDALCDIIR